ncbi:MAG: VOC family protein [Bdellovibrionales bacterium]|nr:VOC family protein [Bdellovibrionales bacterium]
MLSYLHTMIRVLDLEKSIRFYTEGLGFELLSKTDYPEGRFTIAFLKSKSDQGASAPKLELTYNWDTKDYQKGENYGHMAYRVESIDEVRELLKSKGYDLSWGPGLTPNGKTKMAFVDDPDGFEIELLEYRG